MIYLYQGEKIMDKNRIFKAKALHYWLNFTERLAEVILHRRPSSYGVTIKKEIPYGKGKYNNLDLIVPDDSTGKLPLMIYVHGGGWISGVKSMRRTYCYEYAKKGVVVANIDYNRSPIKQFPYPVQDVLDAIDFLFDNAENFNIDTSKIIFGGESAGVYFGMILNFIASHNEALNVMGLKFRHAAEFKIAANVFNCGAFDMRSLATSEFPNMDIMVESLTDISVKDIREGLAEDRINVIYPEKFLDGDFAPTFIICAEHDALMTDSFALKTKLDKLGVENELLKCTGALYGRHAFAVSTVTPTGRKILEKTQAFVFKSVEESKNVSESASTDEKENDSANAA